MDQETPQYGQRIQHDPDEAPVCPRHPGQPTWVRCVRCQRPVCAQCQVSSPVGVHCVDCVEQARRQQQAQAVGRRHSAWSRMPVTWSLVGLNVLVYLLQWVVAPVGIVMIRLGYMPYFTAEQPWTMLTSGFVHSQTSVLHIVLNMYCLWVLGQGLEPRLGKLKFAAVYLVSVVGGSLAVLLLSLPGVPSVLATDPLVPVVGASGGIFGLFGAMLVLTRYHGGDVRGLAVLVVVNLAFGFVVSGVAWQAHVGGLLVGALMAWVLEVWGGRGRRTVRR